MSQKIYDSITIRGDPNIYIDKSVDEDVKITNKEQKISISGECTVELHDKTNLGKNYIVSYNFNTIAGQSSEFYKNLIKNEVQKQCNWLNEVYYEDEAEYNEQVYYGVIIDNTTYENPVLLKNPRIAKKVQGDTPLRELKGKTFRNALLNENFEVYSDMSEYYFEVLQNVEQTNLNKCYEIVYNDLGLPVPEKQDSQDLIKLIIENQLMLNYYIYNDLANTIPSKDRYNRQIYISKYYQHIFISKQNENLFIKLDQLNKKMKPSKTIQVDDMINYVENSIQEIRDHIQNTDTVLIEVESQSDLKEIYDQYVSNNIYPYKTDNKVYVNGHLYKVCNKSDIKQFLDQFQKSQISVDYKFHETLYSKDIYNKDYMCIDFNRCYSHCIDNSELFNIMQIAEIRSYNKDQQIMEGKYYLIQDIKHPLIPCNILTGENLIDLSEYLNINLQEYVISEIIAKVQYQNKFEYNQDMDKNTINIGIGCMYRLNDKTVYRISPEDKIQIYNNVRNNYQFLHCQIINTKISLVLYALKEMNVQFKDILQFHTDSMVIPKNDIWNTLEYGNGDKMFKQELYDEKHYINNKYGTEDIKQQQYNLNATLIQAYAGSGKTFYIKSQLKQFREDREYDDDKCLVLVCKNVNIEQYKEFKDVATIQAYQGIQFQNNFNQLQAYHKIFLDEVYFMDAQFVQALYSQLQSLQYQGEVVFVGDIYQQCNLNCKSYQYMFLQNIQNVQYLTKNWRNDIDYTKFMIDDQFDKNLLKQYIHDNNLEFDPEQINLDNLDTDAVYICKSNDTMAKICTLCNQKRPGFLLNISNDYPSYSVLIRHDVHQTKKGNTVDCIIDAKGRQITSWFGNGITCYKCQDKNIDEVAQLYVAISRLSKQ